MNEFCHELAFRAMSEETKRSLSSPANLYVVSLGSGIVAGFAAAILSQVCRHLFVSTSLPLAFERCALSGRGPSAIGPEVGEVAFAFQG